MYKYRISKYNPKYRDNQGIFLKNEWTSYSDIGKVYEGKMFEKEEYLKVEAQYCDVILCILKTNGTKVLIIKNLELNYSINEVKQMLQIKGLDLLIEDKEIITTLSSNKKITIDDLQVYLKLLLRECFWCELKDENLLNKVEFGYDFYVYIYCQGIPKNLIDRYKQKGIFIERIYS